MKLLIVDDEKLICEGIKIVLSSYPDIETAGLCHNGQEAFLFCKEHKVDVVLMDIRMEVCDGVLATKLIKNSYPEIKVLILTTFKDTRYLQEAVANGASGYLLKDSSSELLYSGVKTAYEGGFVVHPELAGKFMVKEENKKEPEDGLTEREKELVCKIAEGKTNKEIAEVLFLTEGTVKNNVTGILSKLGLRDRTQIAIYAFKRHMVE